MSIEGLVVQEASRHITEYGCVANMEPMALHILKTSQKPLVRKMRGWMRRTALRQALEAEKEQKRMNDELRQDPYRKGASLRRAAVLHPYYATKAVKQGHAWGDRDFVGYVRRENPKVFPERDHI